MWVAVVVAQLNPPWIGVGRTEARVAKYACICGLLASQSRQAAVCLILALVVATLLNPDVRRRSKLMLLGCVPLVVALYYSFSLAARNNPKFNSVSIRVGQISSAFHVWHLSPLLGQGMRFYNLPQFTLRHCAPPNVVIDNLASTGIVGSLAFFYSGRHDHADHEPAAPGHRHPRAGDPAQPLRRRPLRHLLDRGQHDPPAGDRRDVPRGGGPRPECSGPPGGSEPVPGSGPPAGREPRLCPGPVDRWDRWGSPAGPGTP